MRIPELPAIVISWLVISVSFSISYLFYSASLFWLVFLLTAATAGVGFVLHELAHRTVAKKFGFNATYEVWWWGIIVCLMMAIMTQGSLIFAALGAVYITPLASTSFMGEKGFRRAYGLISLSGPAMNLLLAAAFYAISLEGGFLSALGTVGMQINLWLAAFNLIPVPPFDGHKIFSWSKIAWVVFAAPAWLLILSLWVL